MVYMKKIKEWLTVEEVRDRFGNECEACVFFTDEEECKNNHRFFKYALIDGPNEYCHARKYCHDFWMEEREAYGGFLPAGSAYGSC